MRYQEFTIEGKNAVIEAELELHILKILIPMFPLKNLMI